MQTRDYALIDGLRLSEGVHREVEDLLYHYLTYVLEQNLKAARFLHLVREPACSRDNHAEG